MIRTIVILALLLTSGREAGAHDAPKLKELVTVTSDVVRIGDLVDNAGPRANVAVFRAPDLGQTGAVQVDRIAEALKPYDVPGLDTDGLTEVVVTRLSRIITKQDVEQRIGRALAGQFGFGDVTNLSIAFDREVQPMHIEASSISDLAIARMNVEPRSGRFDVSLDVSGSAAARRLPLRFTGRVTETVEAATLTRSVGRGEIIRESDVTVERKPKSEVAAEAIDVNAAIGLSAKRPLRAGQVLRASDLMKAEVVQRNDHVTIVYEVPGVMLTVRGKALESGAVGELISVLNVQSNRTVFAEVSGPGLVTIAATTPRLAAAVASENNRRRRAQ